ncbi:MAG: LuxR C-terminal-related transcriptional regulator [Treponema sp.]|nr:LuxR C-terminal-related transcriptional regulator [Treponema sp.]
MKHLNSKDYKKAETCLLEAAEKGNKDAAYPLALIYRNGYLGKSDYEKALYWYELAAAEENEYTYDAQYALADLYLSGEAVEKDSEKGVFWLQIMAENGDEAARIKLQAIDGLRADPVELARTYLSYKGKNYKKADYWLKKIRGHNSTKDSIRPFLAMMQEALDEEDYPELVKWMNEFSAGGLEVAGEMLSVHKKEGRDLRKKFREEGKFHFSQAKKAGESGNVDEARSEIIKSFSAYLPGIQSLETREDARYLKEKYAEGNLRCGFAKRDQAKGWEHLNLTQREQEIFNLLLTGAAPKEIAYNLEISYPTVNFHTNNLYRKLGIQSRAELFAKYG